MNRIVSILLIAVFLVAGSQNAVLAQDYSGKKILAVFAHPDDEIYVSPLLSKYSRLGADVSLVVVTDGRLGTGQTKLKPGRELVELRKKELACSCSSMDINKAITLDYHDQLKLDKGFFGHVPYAQALLLDLDSVINAVNPDVLITWGPDGGSNHMDHRIVGASVTQIYLNKNRVGKMKLFFVGSPIDQLEGEAKILRGVDPVYMNGRISYEDIDVNNTVAALRCYKSQFSAKKMEERSERLISQEKVIYLREFSGPTAIVTDVLK